MKEGRKPDYTEKTPDDELWWLARKADVLAIARVAPMNTFLTK